MHLIDYDNPADRHLGRALRDQAAAIGDQPFLLYGEQRFSYAQANDRVNALAAGLARRGLVAGERVAFYMDSTPDVIFLALAANKLGAVWVPINSDYKGDWLSDSIARSRPTLLVTDSQHAERVATVRDSLGSLAIACLGECTHLPAAEPLSSLYEEGAGEPDMSGYQSGDTCAVLWTSGTTGRSKGVMQSHNVWFNAVISANNQFGIAPGDVVFSVLPLYNSAAWVTSVFRAMLAGLPLALDPAFSVSTFWDRVDYYGATQSFTLGAMHMFLWNAPSRPDDADHSLKKLMAVPMPAQLAGPFSERFGVQLMPQGLGQSEAFTVINQDNCERDQVPPGSCGTPATGMDVRLVDDGGADVPVGEPGELWLRPRKPHCIFNGYFDDPDATAAAYSGDWYRTGDLLRRDDAGYYYFCDRKKDAVRYKGRNISTFEVEMAVRRHPAVADCAAYGIASDELDSESELKVDVIVKPGMSLEPEQLARFVNDNAPYFFVPRYIESVVALPYTPTNKVQKFRLRERGLTAQTWDARAEGFEVRR
ncbi:AMP-binding protein [Parahaliea maris]|uniref:AMP-binding protein n=1 Tax=Parahaliea maris TaxID=2716870 RepID=A0A5C9A5I7_9GAMM|nr:AMP-binding protein [Parahaliea maris]TXS95349.1 AMP-binding protein [Parahaliea maris]